MKELSKLHIEQISRYEELQWNQYSPTSKYNQYLNIFWRVYNHGKHLFNRISFHCNTSFKYNQNQ